jgi:glycosyltransferase involved in cell wall biosynthesis
MIKILIIGMSDHLGGVERFFFNYINNIKNSSITFAFINMYDKICFQETYERYGFKIFNLPDVKKNVCHFSIKLYRLIREERFEIVHINMLSAANIIPLIVARAAKCKNIIAHSHNSNTIGLLRHILHYCNRFFIKFLATEFFACSYNAGKFLFGKSDKITIIHNAIEVNKFIYNDDKRMVIRDALKIAEETYVIGHIGAFVKEKNHIFIIKTFFQIFQKKKNIILLLVGEGEGLTSIKKNVHELNLDDHVFFYGSSDDISGLYSVMDIFIFPSLFEGLAMVSIEAQCAALPIIVSTTISKESEISDLVQWCDLSDGSQKWATVILLNMANRQLKRKNMSRIITEAGYNIAVESKKLEQKYIDLCSNDK